MICYLNVTQHMVVRTMMIRIGDGMSETIPKFNRGILSTADL